MTVSHAQSANDRQILEAEYVGTLHGEYHQHFGRPHADSLEFRQFGADFFVRQGLEGLDVELSADDFLGCRFDISRFPERDAEPLQFFFRHAVDGLRRNFPQPVLHSCPNRLVRSGGYLLSDDGMYERGEQVGNDGSFDFPDLFYDLCQPFVPPFQVFRFLIAVSEKIVSFHGFRFFRVRVWKVFYRLFV